MGIILPLLVRVTEDCICGGHLFEGLSSLGTFVLVWFKRRADISMQLTWKDILVMRKDNKSEVTVATAYSGTTALDNFCTRT